MNRLPPSMAPERDGAALDMHMPNRVRKAKTQGARRRIIRNALLKIAEHPRGATGGFTTAIVSVIERGMGLSE